MKIWSTLEGGIDEQQRQILALENENGLEIRNRKRPARPKVSNRNFSRNDQRGAKK